MHISNPFTVLNQQTKNYIHILHMLYGLTPNSLRCFMAASSLVFRLHDRGPELVREVLLERGWEEYDGGEREEKDWNLYWRGSAFRSSEYHNLLPWQRLNHHPKTIGITRKDFLARNLGRMRATCGSSLYDFSPNAFILPNDYTRFLAEYKKLHAASGSSVFWICKPVDLSRGRGIFIFEDIKDLVYDCSVIVQRYVSDPLLISGYKFDLRIYVCVKSFHPLTVYVHQEGLVRFATEKYNLSSLHNLYAHLTNTSINKLGPFYKTQKERVGRGCKWTLSKFRHFLHSQHVDERLLWQRINNIVTLTLLTIAPSVPSCPNCVELFGFDILIDANFKPWLLEVNYSPALTLDCQADITVKKGLVSDLIDLMNYTPVDGLRERAYQNHKCKNSCTLHKSALQEPLLQRTTGNIQSSQTRMLPPLKPLHHSKNVNQRQSRQDAFGTNYHRRLPPVDLNRSKVFTTTAANRTHTDKTLNLIFDPQSRTNESVVNRHLRPGLVPWLRDNRSLHVSEVSNPDSSETEAEGKLSGESDVCSRKPEIAQRTTGFRRSAVSWKLPNIYSGSHASTATTPPSDVTTITTGQRIPPLRVGDFIRTFPFNRASLKASQHKLDVKSVIHELQKTTARLISAQSDKTKNRREEEEEEERRTTESDHEEEFDSLFWGPTDPPFISQSR
ncbi:probable tubulin polyglutamylase TTLL2 [Solea solea]|uniref:probable tubulin polyglutamylase TTLL2 n=1 Tax=Solea solea TaxID=90069 RepID=UPI00272982A1|nr:probable tubulin polyglutamylase TTLL2 [Solea solea]